MNENIRTVIAADESEPFCIIEPLNFTFNSRHVPYSGRTVDTRWCCGPQTDFSSLSFATAIGKGRMDTGNDLTFSPDVYPSYTRYFGFVIFCASLPRHVN